MMVCPEDAKVHILEDEDGSRAYLFAGVGGSYGDLPGRELLHEIQQVHTEEISGGSKDFMPEDTEAGMIVGFLETYQGNQVCSKQLYREALHHEYDEPKRWQIHDINEIMNSVVTGWRYFSKQFIVSREFAGSQTMQEAFEQLIERQTCERFEEWQKRQAS